MPKGICLYLYITTGKYGRQRDLLIPPLQPPGRRLPGGMKPKCCGKEQEEIKQTSTDGDFLELEASVTTGKGSVGRTSPASAMTSYRCNVPIGLRNDFNRALPPPKKPREVGRGWRGGHPRPLPLRPSSLTVPVPPAEGPNQPPPPLVHPPPVSTTPPS